jgi:hypothetical protein
MKYIVFKKNPYDSDYSMVAEYETLEKLNEAILNGSVRGDCTICRRLSIQAVE